MRRRGRSRRGDSPDAVTLLTRGRGDAGQSSINLDPSPRLSVAASSFPAPLS
ncbi:hypothetical protein [Microseira wollei]|uniref:hypothetical protein n=1 Tax=Microseira wollei TaxID=467598 RepID=UPI001CFCC485|nr:hypothetical protein [Microseira wollei]